MNATFVLLMLGCILLWLSRQQTHDETSDDTAAAAVAITRAKGPLRSRQERAYLQDGTIQHRPNAEMYQQQPLHKTQGQSRNLRAADSFNGPNYHHEHDHRLLKPILAATPLKSIFDGFRCLLLKKDTMYHTAQPDGSFIGSLEEEWNCQLLAFPPLPSSVASSIILEGGDGDNDGIDSDSDVRMRPVSHGAQIGSIVKIVGLEGWLEGLEQEALNEIKAKSGSVYAGSNVKVKFDAEIFRAKFDRSIKRFAQSGRTEMVCRNAKLDGNTLYLRPDNIFQEETTSTQVNIADIDLIDLVTGVSMLQRLKDERDGGNRSRDLMDDGSVSKKKGGTFTATTFTHRQLQDDGLVATTGTKKVLVVRPSKGGSLSESDLARRVFGNDAPASDISLRSGMKACSHQQVDFQPTVGYPSVNNGVITVTVDTPLSVGDSSVLSEMVAKAEQAMGLGNGLPGNFINDHFDHVLVCLPAGTPGSWYVTFCLVYNSFASLCLAVFSPRSSKSSSTFNLGMKKPGSHMRF